MKTNGNIRASELITILQGYVDMGLDKEVCISGNNSTTPRRIGSITQDEVAGCEIINLREG